MPDAPTALAWERFRASWLWGTLRRSPLLRNLVYFLIEHARLLHESNANPEVWDAQYALRNGTWTYETNPTEQRYFDQMQALLDLASHGSRFKRALEVGCGDGNFTSVLAPRCQALLTVDVSSNAISRAKERCSWPSSVIFQKWDLRTDPVRSTHDLVVIGCVLETIYRPWLLTRVRDKLVDALEPGGHLLVATMRLNPVVENSRWGKSMHRGRWIVTHFANHRDVILTGEALSDEYAFAIVTKRGDYAPSASE